MNGLPELVGEVVQRLTWGRATHHEQLNLNGMTVVMGVADRAVAAGSYSPPFWT